MTQGNDTNGVPTDAQIDMLVDGELGEAERSELLASLDRCADGWRRCALAFLAAQCWRDSLRSLPQAPRPPATQAVAVPPSVPRRSIRWSPYVTAATVLVALALGTYLGQQLPPRGSDIAPDSLAATTGSAEDRPLSAAAATAASTNRPIDRGPLVTVPVADPAAGRIDLPCQEGSFSGDTLAASPPLSLPPELVKILRRSGHRIEQQRDVVPMETEDGRRVMVPVDEIELRYVGSRAFQ